MLRRPAQWPSISQACGRITATWSVMLRAFDGPVPILIMVMPPLSGATRWKAGICGVRCGGAPVGPAPPRRALRVMTLPGSTKASPSGSPFAMRWRQMQREGVDVELVVGEDHEVLEVLGIGAGVVIEPMQRVVDAGGTEQGERRRRAGRQLQACR